MYVACIHRVLLYRAVHVCGLYTSCIAIYSACMWPVYIVYCYIGQCMYAACIHRVLLYRAVHVCGLYTSCIAI